MKKILKTTFLIIFTIWVLITSAFTILILKNGWDEVQRNEWKELLAFKIDRDPDAHELKIEIDSIPYRFSDRISNLEFDEIFDAIQEVYEFDSPSLPHNSHHELIDSFETIFLKWPQPLKDIVNQYIARVYFIRDIPSSGRIFQLDGSEKFIVIINEEVLNQSANEWITAVEQSAIREESTNNHVSINIENSDSPVYTLENILIHELGHAFGVINNLTPNFNASLNNEHFSFYSESHIPRINMEPKDEFLDRYKALKYYGYPSDKLSYDQYKELVISLDKTPFPTMYGSTRPLEFFAEIFYSYVHCVIQNKPYEIKFIEDGDEKEIIFNGILSDRCKTQREIIAQYFKGK